MNPALGWGCEISPSGVALASWNGGAGPGTAAWRPLTAGAIEVSPVRENLQRPDEVREALSGCLEALGRPAAATASSHTAGIALIIPDQAARVFFLSFDQFPSQPSEAIPLIRWKLRKSVPFEIDTSTVSYVARRAAAEWEVLAVVSPAVIVQQYESLPESLGLKPRFVTLSTLGCLGLVASSEETSTTAPGGESYLLAKYSPPWLTTTILHEGSVRLFRTVPIGSSGTAGSVTDTLREILEAVHPSVAYYQDSFGKPLERAYLCGLGEWGGVLAESLASELQLRTSHLLREPTPVVSGMDSPLAERHLAALMGVSRMRRGT
jgi:type IV pilus assembly protein PilM